MSLHPRLVAWNPLGLKYFENTKAMKMFNQKYCNAGITAMVTG